jgi:hypothetical protein
MIFIRRSHTILFVTAIVGISAFVADERGLVGAMTEQGMALVRAEESNQGGGVQEGPVAEAPADEVVMVDGWDDVEGEEAVETDMEIDPYEAVPDLDPEPDVDPMADAMDIAGPDAGDFDPVEPDQGDDW